MKIFIKINQCHENVRWNLILYYLSTDINGCVWTGQLDRGPVLENMFWFATNPPMSVTHKINYCNCHYVTSRLRCNNSFTWVISNQEVFYLTMIIEQSYWIPSVVDLDYIFIKSVNIVHPHSTCAVNCEWSIWNIFCTLFSISKNPSKLMAFHNVNNPIKVHAA